EDEAGDWKAGEAAHRKAIAFAPQRDDLLNNLGYSLLEQGRKAEAADVFREALKVNSKSLIARNNLGTALAENPKEAAKTLNAGAGPVAAHNNLAVTMIEAGNYADARRELQTALSYDPHNATALKNLALVSSLDGKPAELAASRKPGPWSRI